MRNITKIIFTNRQLASKKFADFYINAKKYKYRETYGWDDVERDFNLAFQDMQLLPSSKTITEWLNNGFNVARNKRGWAFAYIIKDDTMYIYDVENCRNLTIDYQNTSPFTTYTKGKISSNEWVSIRYGITAYRAEDGYIYLYKNGQKLPNYRFNEIIKPFYKYQNGEIYAIGLYGSKQFKITLDGIARALAESKITKIVRNTVSKILSEATNKPQVKERLGEWVCIDGLWWDGTPHGLESKGLVQDVRMYDKQTDNDTFETIALFRRCDNRKFFYAQIIPIENSKETKWEPLPLNKVPSIIKDDIKSINPQGHESYLPV